MKTTAIVTMSFLMTSTAVLAGETPINNSDCIEARLPAAQPSQPAGAPYPHEYLNEGYFEAERDAQLAASEPDRKTQLAVVAARTPTH